MIQKNIVRLERLVTDVSDVSQLDLQIIEAHKKTLNISEFIKKEIMIFKNLLGEQFDYQIQNESEFLVDFDKERIHQVLDNLINNAIKHTAKESRKISLTVINLPNVLQIEIKDNGAGIDKKNIEHIFEPFVSIGTQYTVVGAGLGLYLCRRILQVHDGTIVAQSDGLNKGSIFRIELPRSHLG